MVNYNSCSLNSFNRLFNKLIFHKRVISVENFIITKIIINEIYTLVILGEKQHSVFAFSYSLSGALYSFIFWAFEIASVYNFIEMFFSFPSIDSLAPTWLKKLKDSIPWYSCISGLNVQARKNFSSSSCLILLYLLKRFSFRIS